MSDTRDRLFGRPGELLVEESPRIWMPSPPPGPWADEEPSGPMRVEDVSLEVNTGPLRIMVGPPMAQLGGSDAAMEPPRRPGSPFEALKVSEPPRPPPRPARPAAPTLRVEPALPRGPGIPTAAARRKAEARRDPNRVEEIPLEVFDLPRADLAVPMATLMADSEPTPAKVFASEVRPPEPIRLAPLPAENTIPPAPLFAELSDPLLVAPTVRPAAPYREAAPVRLPATAAAQRRRRVLVVVGFAVVVLGLAVAAKLQIALWRGQHPASPQAVQTVPVSPPPTRPIADPTPPLVPDPSPPPVAAPVEAPPAPPAPPPVAEPVASPPAPPEVAAAPPAPVAPTPTAVTKPAVVTLVPRAETPSSVTSSTTLIEALRPKGLLMVVSDRKGTIYIDDVKKGSTTDSRPMELLSGVHRVKVVAGGRTKSMEVRVDAEQVRMVEFRFAK